MKKQLLLLGITLLLSASAGARRLTVTVTTPGTLSELIKPADKYKITSLTLRGTLNGSDLRFLREMAGSDYEMRPTEGRLVDVDLTDVVFGRGGAAYINKDGACYLSGGSYTVPKFLFRKTRVEHVVLPSRTDTIAFGALEYTRLRKVQIPENAYIDSYAFNANPELEEVVFPSYVNAINAHAFSECPKLKELVLNDVGYVSGNGFAQVTGAERIVIRGMLGHIDGFYTFSRSPHLRSVRFEGPVLSTGGPVMFSNCPELSEVVFNGPVCVTAIGESENCPKLNKYQANAMVYSGADSTCFEGPGLQYEMESARTDQACVLLYDTYMRVQALSHGAFPFGYAKRTLNRVFYQLACRTATTHPQLAMDYLEQAVRAGYDQYGTLMQEEAFKPLHTNSLFLRISQQLRADDDYQRAENDYLNVLRTSAPYATQQPFTYAAPTDSGLQRVRQFFNVDSIAGTGDEISRIKRLMYWVHDHIRHDGSSSWPDCPYNAVDLYQVTVRDKRGLNCRFLATVLNELYLAAGFKSRFITCQSKRYQTDPDCHVINMVWSESLGKWVWMDPSFAAYVTDENGLLLHPGEVRERLQKGLPLVLNDDANWNHESKQTVENYLENYMAKNLYVISAYLYSGYQLESKNGRQHDNPMVALVPEGFSFSQASVITSDPAYFWQAPQ